MLCDFYCAIKDTCPEHQEAVREQESKRKGNKAVRKFEEKKDRYGCTKFKKKEF